MIRVITVSRQYGSGGAEIARRLAARLGWRLVDQSMIGEIAARARVSLSVVASLDEHVDPWFQRMAKALWQGGYEGAASSIESLPFDSETMAAATSKLILEAAALGDAVIVGRGAQCVLHNLKDVFHVSIHAPRPFRIANLRERLPAGTDLEAAIEQSDRQRASYIRRYFNRDWTDRSLYHLVVCASLGVDTVVSTILTAAGLAGKVNP